MSEHCISCGIESGSLLVCQPCRRSHKTGYFDRQFQQRVCADAGYICSYCGANCSEPEERRKLVCADHQYAQMFAIELPSSSIDKLGTRLWDEYKIEVPLVRLNDREYLRVSIQAYNKVEDIERLTIALKELL